MQLTGIRQFLGGGRRSRRKLRCTSSTSAYMARGLDSRVGPCLDIVRFALRQEREGAILGLVEMRRNEGLGRRKS
jgi:hypothetical protein